MKITLTNTNQVITYDDKSVFIGNKQLASYTTSNVIRLLTNQTIGSIYRISGNTYGKLIHFPQIEIRTNLSDHTLRSIPSETVVATFEGTPCGAIASYIMHKYLELASSKKEFTKKVEIKNTPSKSHKNILDPIKPPQYEPEDKKTKKECITPKKPIEPKEPIIIKKELPKELPVEKEPFQKDFNLPPPPISSGTNSEGSSGAGCLVIIIVAIFIYFAIKLIPQSWEDLSVFIPQRDSGIIICFFSAVIGAIVALLMSIFSKEPRFLSCMSGFLGICAAGVVINSIIVLAEGVEFTGFFLFDIPLSIFAPILGCFQFAFPIGIGVSIICGIICLARKK